LRGIWGSIVEGKAYELREIQEGGGQIDIQNFFL
jgi:hypothetical protein